MFNRATFIRSVFVGLFILSVSACSSLIKEPDSCDHEAQCELNSQISSAVIHLEIGKSEDVFICGCNPWNESTVHVEKGEEYTFSFKEINHWKDAEIDADPVEGWQGWFNKFVGFFVSPLKRSSKAKWYALVGAIDKNEKQIVAIIRAEDGSVTMPASGTLYFYANDMEGRYANNQGTILLNVSRVK